MAKPVEKFESWGADFDKFLNDKVPPPGPRDILGLYRKTRDYLTFSQHQNWKTGLLALTVVHFAAHFYLFYRQYRVLQRSTRPRVLRNVLTDSEFTSARTYQISFIRFRFIRDLWKLAVILILITLDVLPKIWVNTDTFVWDILDRSLLNMYEKTFHHPLLLPLFYLACALLWNILMAPSDYYEECILGTCPPKCEKQTPQQWINGLLKSQLIHFGRMWLMIFLQYGSMNINYDSDRAFHETFNSLEDIVTLFTIYYLFVRPFIPARFLNLTPLRPGKTKSTIEALARELAFPLGSIYTFPRKNSYEDAVSTSGWFGKRRMAITVDTLEKCNTEEVVALVAVEMGTRKHNPFYELAVKSLGFVLYLAPIWILHFNWRSVTQSVGFKHSFVDYPRHPLQVLVLIYGGALDPLFHLSNALIYEITRLVDARANVAAVRRGYGMQLARALIKLEKDKVEVPVADPAYSKAFRGSQRLLSVALKDLDWTGEEEMEKEGEKGKLNHHWEMD